MRFKRMHRRVRVTLLLLGALLFIPLEALLLPDVLDTRAACVRAKEWLAAHQHKLPTFYDQLISYPMGHRRAIFGNLSAEARASLWREQLSRFQERLQPSSEQFEFVEWSKVEVVTPDNYRRGGPGKAVILDAVRRVEELFSEIDDRKVFVQLGPDEPRFTSIEGSRLTIAQGLQDLFQRGPSRPSSGYILHRSSQINVQADAESSGTCLCNVENAWWWECGTAYDCRSVGCDSWQACGPFGFDICDGCCCRYNLPDEFCHCN